MARRKAVEVEVETVEAAARREALAAERDRGRRDGLAERDARARTLADLARQHEATAAYMAGRAETEW